MHPIVQRELVGLLRTRKALFFQGATVVLYAILVLLRWPADSQVDWAGIQAWRVFRTLGYGLTAVIVLLTPAFPATAFVRERKQGTLALLISSPMRPWSIYLGKLFGMLGFVAILLGLSLPSTAACYALGGLSLLEHIIPLYAVLAVAGLQFTTVGLWVSGRAGSTDAALRLTYGLALVLSVVALGPHLFLQGGTGLYPQIAEWVRCVSPIPAVMEVLQHGSVGAQGLASSVDVSARYVAIGLAMAAACAGLSIARLNYAMFDRSRPPGVITDERSKSQRMLRRLVFLVDPQRRKSAIGPLVNPVMVKEFRSRRFGRSHWMLRLVAGCALISLGLVYAASLGSVDWGIATIGGIMVLLQIALIVLLTPSLASGLISAERESGGWVLLQMTPLSPWKVLRGKLLSAFWPLLLILTATLPGYLVMIYIDPRMWPEISRVLTTLLLTALFALLASAAVGSMFRCTAQATAAAYVVLIVLCAGTMLVWQGRDAPFGRSTVEAVLRFNPLAAALGLIHAPGFAEYDLVPANWWFLGWASAVSLGILFVQTWRLTRPQ
jgi:ABC-type transport system involved in multi-copper enzyme maturation permease subunit